MLRAGRGFFGAVLLMVSFASAEVTVKFSNSTLLMDRMNKPGKITLLFSVDVSGNVVLDASAESTEQIVQDIVNAWDGPVGTVSYFGAYNTNFSLSVVAGGSGLRLGSDEGGGLGVKGQDSLRIDRPGFEFISVEASIDVGSLDFCSVSWNNRSSMETRMALAGPYVSLTRELLSTSGKWDLSGQGVILGDSQSLKFENGEGFKDISGYALAGFSFDVIDADTPVTVGFIRKFNVFDAYCAAAQSARL